MRVHHLDGGTMRPAAGHLLNDAGYLACHVLVIELDGGGLALVDTGIGASALRDPAGRLGPMSRVLRAGSDPEGTVAAQLGRLGFAPGDVTDVLMTHLDIDHASALDEFPGATVHLHARELDAALSPLLRERTRYQAANWAHGPRWAPFGQGAPDRDWHGFDAYELLGGAVLALPLPGHSRGHTGYAVGDLLHAGDAFYHAGALDPDGRPSRALQVFELFAAAEPRRLAGHHRRLQALGQRGDVTIICTHEPAFLDL